VKIFIFFKALDCKNIAYRSEYTNLQYIEYRR
jgi:hypothetical protein